MALYLQCPNDPKAELISDSRSGDVICGLCGLVVAGRVIAVDQEFPTYFDASSATDPTWIGATRRTYADAADRYPTGSEIRDKEFAMRRKAIDQADRQLKAAICSIYELSEKISLPRPVRLQAVKSFRDLCDSKELRKIPCDATAAACVYIACRLQKVPRTFLEICSISGVPKRVIARSFKRIVRALGTDFDQITSSDYLSRFCGHLDLNFRVLACANHIATKIRQLDLLPGRLPLSVAAAAICSAAEAVGHPCAAADVAAVAGVSEDTVRTLQSILRDHKSEIIPSMYLKKKKPGQ
ncbi:CRE-TTB-1 protein [Aphelenchoides avenae]|nr:CRE-TTB-1 protein [Aphelenchus avenae]